MNRQQNDGYKSSIDAKRDPNKIDPTKQDERDNDPTRIKPIVKEPGKTDPTQPETPNQPTPPTEPGNESKREPNPNPGRAHVKGFGV